MNTRLAVELSKLDAVEAVTSLKAEVDALRPLPPETELRIMQKFRLDWNYHSNSIEGNQLNYGETVAFLMHGLTAKGKPLKDHLDIRGHNQAIEFLMSLVKEDRGISEADIRGLHNMILVEPYEVDALTPDGQPTKKMIRLGEYKRESNSVRTRTGEIHYYATPEETPARMQALMAWFDETKSNPDVHPLVLSALFHHEFTAIHPFDDGNGRMARLLSNLILMQSGYLPVVVKSVAKDEYFSVLSQADVFNYIPLIIYFGDLSIHSLSLYLRGAKGGNIEENHDIDKEITLFIASIDRKILDREKINNFLFKNAIITSIFPCLYSLQMLFHNFDKLFFDNKYKLIANWKYSRSIQTFSVVLSDGPRKQNQSVSEMSWKSDENFQFKLPSEYGNDQAEIFLHDLEEAYVNNSTKLKKIFPEYIKLSVNWSDFKSESDHFNLKIHISFLIQENHYLFALFIDESEKYSFKKYYNEQIDSDEMKNVKSICAEFILTYLKQKINAS